MPKIEICKVAEVLQKNHIEPAVLRRIIEEINLVVQPDPAEEAAPPPAKKQWVILISDPDQRLPKDDFTGWVLQIPESESPATTLDRIFRGAYDFNASKRGRLLPVTTVGEAIENVPAKHLKEAEVWVKSKTPVLMLRTDNRIPTDDANHIDHRRRDDEAPAAAAG
ncbi:MAG: hypothetical protein PHE83_17295 [Opitutaceae bacterium]|nr:hypothetical protein [Opitutaceae bacterium]